MDLWLEFDLQGKWGVDGMNLLIGIKVSHSRGLFPHYITYSPYNQINFTFLNSYGDYFTSSM